jgi:hypothetical protein
MISDKRRKGVNKEEGRAHTRMQPSVVGCLSPGSLKESGKCISELTILEGEWEIC